MQNCFMYGDWTGERGPPSPVKTVLLVGFQGQTRLLTGTHEELWREFMVGDGGYGCNGIQPIGWHYSIEQELGTNRLEDCIIDSPTVQRLIQAKGE